MYFAFNLYLINYTVIANHLFSQSLIICVFNHPTGHLHVFSGYLSLAHCCPSRPPCPLPRSPFLSLSPLSLPSLLLHPNIPCACVCVCARTRVCVHLSSLPLHLNIPSSPTRPMAPYISFRMGSTVTRVRAHAHNRAHTHRAPQTRERV